MLFCGLKKGLATKFCMLCFVIINGILFNFLFDWILFYNAIASSYSCFRFVFSPYGMVDPLQKTGGKGHRGWGLVLIQVTCKQTQSNPL